MSCIHTLKCSFSKGFFPVLIWGYLLFHHSTQWAPKYTFAKSTTTVLANCSKKGTVELCVMKSHIRKQSLRKLLSSYYVRIFPFSPWATWAPKYPFPVSMKIVLANCSKKGRVEFCGTKSHIRKQSLRKLLSTSYVTLFPLTMGPYGLPNITFQIPRKEC